MNTELLTKLSTLNEKEIAYLLGVVDGLNATTFTLNAKPGPRHLPKSRSRRKT